LVKAKGFTEWTEIQEKAIPLVLEGKNILAIAPTGFGKSEVAFLPILSKVLDAREKGDSRGIKALYISPLRALNRDLMERLLFWTRVLGITLAVRHGDTTASERVKQRDQPAEIFITTPETLQSMLVAPKLKDSLSNVKFVVVDEVHELVESKRGLQLELGLERLREKAPGFQVIGLSATVGDEKEAARFIARDAIVVKSSLERGLKASVECPTRPKTDALEELGVSKESRAKLERVIDLIETHSRTLLFVNTRYIAESLASLLLETRLKDEIAVHHSSLSKETRLETEKEFKSFGGKLKAIICTSSLELGIDVGSVDLMIQFVSPRQVTRFLQRIGRSGHRKHLTPKGVVIANDALDCFESAAIISRAKKGLLEPLEIRKNALDVVAHQAAGLALDFDQLTVEKAFALIKRARSFETLSLQEFIEVLKQASDARNILFDGTRFSANKKTRLYYYENLSTIRDTKKYFVKDAEKRKNVGVLDEDFVSEYLYPNATFIARGRAWKVLSISDDEVVVEATRDLGAAIPDWVGEEIPIAREVAEQTNDLIAKLGEAHASEELAQELYCSQDALKKMLEFAREQKKFFTPNASEIVIETNKDFAAVHCFAGTKANETLSRALSALLTASLGASVRSKASAYGFLLEFPKSVNGDKIKQALQELSGRSLRAVLNQALPHSTLFRHKFVGVAKAFGVLRKDSELGGFGVRRLVEALWDTPVFKEALEETFFDKLDLQAAAEALGKKILLIQDRGEWSPLAKQFFNYGAFSELLVPAEPSSQVVQAFKQELLEKRVRLSCTYCGKAFGRALAEDRPLACPYCKSTQLTLADYEEVIEKKKKKKELNEEEKTKLREAKRVVSLVGAYGKRALLALETFGVGPKSASRVLSRLQKTDDEFYADLLEAQKKFIKTRRFWQL
ncbi:DEAD/DEAH box helicase, partial [Candidatus Micrarchaeota archaeon]|nr:DEAD/DEAH box helicase [Candidatus Micrarchaeota archaeon]